MCCAKGDIRPKQLMYTVSLGCIKRSTSDWVLAFRIFKYYFYFKNYAYVCACWVQCSWKAKEGIRCPWSWSHGSAVSHWHGCWELSSCLLQEQDAVLTSAPPSSPSMQVSVCSSKVSIQWLNHIAWEPMAIKWHVATLMSYLLSIYNVSGIKPTVWQQGWTIRASVAFNRGDRHK